MNTCCDLMPSSITPSLHLNSMATKHEFDLNLSLIYWSLASDPRAADCSHVVILVTFNIHGHHLHYLHHDHDNHDRHRHHHHHRFHWCLTRSSLNSSIMPRTPARKNTWQWQYNQLKIEGLLGSYGVFWGLETLDESRGWELLVGIGKL